MAKKASFRTDRPQLGSQAYFALKKLLVSGALPAGRFLSERQLAAQLGMSKTPVHSALERLRAEGFLDISPRQEAASPAAVRWISSRSANSRRNNQSDK